jgi:ElaB/YqjD/DUF883 family membrane-anchored ribosome-binding protein
MTARTETLSKDVEELRAAIDKLTSDVSAIGKSVAGDARASASQKASEMSDAAKQKAAEIGEKGQAAKGAVEDTVRDRPLQSVALAFGAGMLLAGLISRR